MLIFSSINSPNDSLSADSEYLDRLIYNIADGDCNALAVLYEKTSKNVYSFALSILKDTHMAQDVLQDCYLNIYSSAVSYSGRGKPMAWILTITRNLCLKCIRYQTKCIPVSDEEWSFTPQEETDFSAEDRIILSQCMNLLNDTERQIVVLHAVSSLKHREIASLLKIPLPTVLSKYNRAIKKLRNAFEKGT